jgi:peptidoglycan/LPS O-acetylase OafA/YrhL
VKPKAFALTGLAALAAFSVLPAWRSQLFGEDYDVYYALRAGTLSVLVAMFFIFCRGFTVDLSIGNRFPAKTGYGDPLLSLRAFACAVVLIGHGTAMAFPPTDVARELSESRTLWLLFPSPWVGVWIFFTLSGYLMGKGFFTGRYQFSRDGISRFYRNRLLRLVPLAYFSIAVMVVFVHPEATSAANIKHLIALLLFDYDGTAPLSLIGLLWSIATEMQFYLIAPFAAFVIHLVTQRASIFFIAGWLLAFGTAYRFGCLIFAGVLAWYGAAYTSLLGNLDIFGIGMMTSFVVQQYPIKWPRVGYGVALVGALYIVCAVCLSRMLVASPHWAGAMQYCAPPLFSLATACIIVMFENAVATSKEVSPVTRTVIASTQLFGTLTYAIYIWHAPIFQAYATLLVKPISPSQTISALAVASSLVFGFSWAIYRLIEKPFDDLRSRKEVYVNLPI